MGDGNNGLAVVLVMVMLASVRTKTASSLLAPFVPPTMKMCVRLFVVLHSNTAENREKTNTSITALEDERSILATVNLPARSQGTSLWYVPQLMYALSATTCMEAPLKAGRLSVNVAARVFDGTTGMLLQDSDLVLSSHKSL